MLPKGTVEMQGMPLARTVYKRPTNVPNFFRVWVFGKNGFSGEVKLDLGGGCFLGSYLGRFFLFFFYFLRGVVLCGVDSVAGVAWLSNQLSKYYG